MRISLVTTLVCALALSATAQRGGNMREQAMKRMSSAKYEEILGRRGNGPAPGTVAPDFALETIKDYEIKAGAKGEDIRLSDFKGDRPVVLIFGSYT
jgi:hypothetical protein